MKALVVGAGGQLGRALLASAPQGWTAIGLSREGLDIRDAVAIHRTVRLHAPDLLINAAAYTAVDRAESEVEAAFQVNATAVGELARAAHQVAARFLHVSTDFVFDGERSTPYPPEAIPAPLGVYGASKAAGEAAALAEAPRALIVRTAWVYAAKGQNFVSTMLRLMRERPELRVVADQLGTPTHAAGLARTLWALAERDCEGIYHATDAGVASWYDFAVAIQEEAVAAGLLGHAVPVRPIATADYPTPARRPAAAILDKTRTWDTLGATAPHWREALREMVREVALG